MNTKFIRRLAEQCAVAFATTAAAVLAVPGTALDKATLIAAAAAGGRAAYGVIVRRVGDYDQPQAK